MAELPFLLEGKPTPIYKRFLPPWFTPSLSRSFQHSHVLFLVSLGNFQVIKGATDHVLGGVRRDRTAKIRGGNRCNLGPISVVDGGFRPWEVGLCQYFLH